jgi:predicted amidohydrolase
MKVAAYQAPLDRGDSRGAVELIRGQIADCEAQGVSILCCPEGVLGGLADDVARPWDMALDVGSGALAAMLAPLASRTVATIVGFTEASGDALYNTAAVFANGEVAGLYRKRRPARRASVYAAGEESPVFNIGGLAFGIMICNDTNFPEFAAGMAAAGARVLFTPSNNALRPERADVLAETRAVDVETARRNRVAVIRADLAGEAGGRIAYGTSAIIDAQGRVLRAGERLREGLLVAELDGI